MFGYVLRVVFFYVYKAVESGFWTTGPLLKLEGTNDHNFVFKRTNNSVVYSSIIEIGSIMTYDVV